FPVFKKRVEFRGSQAMKILESQYGHPSSVVKASLKRVTIELQKPQILTQYWKRLPLLTNKGGTRDPGQKIIQYRMELMLAEVKKWLYRSYPSRIEIETNGFMQQMDRNKDGILNQNEILNNWDQFNKNYPDLQSVLLEHDEL
ncbi:Hypothetical predicted protein, partial [Paramuricea clavata]